MEAVETERIGNFLIEIFQDNNGFSPRENFDHLGHMVCWHSRYNLGDEFRKDSQEDFMQELAEAVDDTVEDRIYYWEDGEGYSKLYHDCEREFPDKCWMDRPTCDRVNEKIMAIVNKTVDEHYIMLPLYLYDHSGITMSTGPFSCRWDSGQVGWIYVTKEQVRKEYGWKNLSKKRIETIEGYLKGEIEEYDRFLTGQVYGYDVTELGECKHCGTAIEEDIDSCGGFYMDPEDVIELVKEEVLSCGGSQLGDCECYRYKQLLKALDQESELFDSIESSMALAGRLDARMEASSC